LAWAPVQAGGTAVGGGAAWTSVHSENTGFAASATGNKITCVVTVMGSTQCNVTGLTDNAGNTWTKVKAITGTSLDEQSEWELTVPAGNPTISSIKVTFTGTVGLGSLVVEEISGLATVNNYDGTPNASNSSYAIQNGSAATASNEYCHGSGQDNGQNVTWVASGIWTKGEHNDPDGTVETSTERANSTSGTNPTTGWSTLGTLGTAIIVIYKLAAGGAAPISPSPSRLRSLQSLSLNPRSRLQRAFMSPQRLAYPAISTATTWGLAGIGAAVSSGAAALNDAMAITGAGAAAATGLGALTSIEQIAASGAAVGGGLGALTSIEQIAATGAAIASGAGAIATLEQMGATGAAAATGTGALTMIMQLAAHGAVVASGAADITDLPPGATTWQIAGVGVASATGAGALNMTEQIAASGAATVTGLGALTESRELDASGAAVGNGVGSFIAIDALAASGAVIAGGLGALVAKDQMAGAGAALVNGTGALIMLVQLSANGAAVVSGAGDITRATASIWAIAAAGAAIVGGLGALSVFIPASIFDLLVLGTADNRVGINTAPNTLALRTADNAFMLSSEDVTLKLGSVDNALKVGSD
jgi:hypothetical protein